MSVPSWNRKVANTDFERAFSIYYKYTSARLSRVAKRKQKWICSKIYNVINDTYNKISLIQDYHFDNINEYFTAIESARDNIISLQRLMFVFWNVERTETRRMVYWNKLLKEAYDRLNRKTKTKKSFNPLILDYKAIDEMYYLSLMRELHIFVHSKVVNAKNIYDETAGKRLIDLVDQAFCCCMFANYYYPDTEQKYAIREKYLKQAFGALKNMQRPMFSYFNLMKYSEYTMKKWTTLLIKEMDLIQAVQASDKERRYQRIQSKD